MKNNYLNIFGIAVGLFILNIPPFILDAMIDEINMENFGYLGGAIAITVFLCFTVARLKFFSWLKRISIGLIFLSVFSVIFNFSILNKSSEIYKSLGVIENSKKANSLDDILSIEPYVLNTSILPDLKARGEVSIITDKRRKLGADYYVFPIPNNDSIKYFFGVRVIDGMMELPYEFRLRMIESKNRLAIIQQDTNYYKAIENFKANISRKVVKNAKVLYVYDLVQIKSYYNYYLFWTFGFTNLLYFIALLIMNVKLKRSEETVQIE